MLWRAKGTPLDNLSGANVTELRGFALVRKCCCAGTPKRGCALFTISHLHPS